jgi:membrane dipeptidase
MRIMSSAICLILLSACASATPAPDQSPSQSEASVLERARTIHERAITIDTHDDIPFDFATPAVNPCGTLERKVDLPKMRAGGLDVAFFAVFVGQTPRLPENYEKAKADAMTKFTAIHRMAEQLCPDQIEIAYTADDVVRINRSGKLVAAIGIENGYVIGKDLSLLKKYHALGARYITLAHGGHNDIADSATPRPNEPAEEHDGVSAFGEQVVAEMNRVGIMVDVSHISKDAMLDAVRLSKAPVIASHSSARAVNDNARNMDDEQLRALKVNGGVMQTVALGAFVRNPPADKQAAIQTLREQFGITGGGGAAMQALSPERRADFQRRMTEIEQKWPGPTLTDFVDHIDHAVKLIGIDHVGISSDFDGGGGIPGWNTAAESLNVTVELVRRGYTEEQITKLWGGNLLRVWREVERVATELQRTAT